VRLNFGKYRGWELSEVPESYLRWVLEECHSATPSLRRAIHELLEGDSLELREDVVRRWYREMCVKFHPDRGGDVEAMKAINYAYERLVELLRDQA